MRLLFCHPFEYLMSARKQNSTLLPIHLLGWFPSASPLSVGQRDMEKQDWTYKGKRGEESFVKEHKDGGL